MRSLHSNRKMVTLSRRPFGQLGCAEGETFATEATPASSFGLCRARLAHRKDRLFRLSRGAPNERNPATGICRDGGIEAYPCRRVALIRGDRKSTRLNSSHVRISYAVFFLKKKYTIN